MPASAQENHAPLDKFQWTYDTDPYGSEAIINEKLIRHGGIWIKFKRVPQKSQEHNTWAELIHKIPANSLENVQTIRITYQSEVALMVYLPQAQYENGDDKNYVYFQTELPATTQWITKEIPLKEFKQPQSSTVISAEQVLIPARISTVNFSPKFTAKKGGEAIIQVRAIALLP